MADQLVTEIELNISAADLEDHDAIGKSDPICIVYLKDSTNSHLDYDCEIGKTEILFNTLSPSWATAIKIPYRFEEKQELKFKIYDADYTSLDDSLGKLKCSVGELVSSPVPFTRPLGKKSGTISIVATEVVDSKQDAVFSVSAKNLDKKDFFGKSDPYFVISKQIREAWITVYRSEVVKGDLSPEWRPFYVPAHKLRPDKDGVGSEFRVEVFDWDEDTQDDLIGQFTTTFEEFQASASFPLINEKKKAKKGSSYKNSGNFIVQSSRLEKRFSFLDFIQGGTSLHFTVAVDFTGSNGNPSDRRSLHFNDPIYPNQYVQAIRSVGGIIQDYDTDKLFPALGFGGKLPDGSVSHEFFLNGHPTNPYCQGVEGILSAYSTSLTNVQLWGPTNFSPVINHVARFASESQDGSNYFVLLIITDGIITDMDEAVEAMVKASFLPMSIIIIGVGEADFSAMSILDGDGERLKSGGNVAARDIVQFVKFSDYCVSEQGGAATPTLFVQNQAKLAKAVLAEVPNQLTEFMKYRGFTPLNQC